jgi:hypothetical protein
MLIIKISFGQNGNLIPLESYNYIMVGDSLIDQFLKFPSPGTAVRFEPKKIRDCPCQVDNVGGVISFKSAAFIHHDNTCFYIYLTDKGYLMKVGRIITRKGINTYQFKTVSIEESFAKKLIQEFKKAISEAQIPRYSSWGEYPIVTDGQQYVFGDFERNKFGIAPETKYSELVTLIIKESTRLVNRNLK